MEKLIHNVEIRVFSKEEDDYDKIKAALLTLLPFDMEKEKIMVKEQKAEGFFDKKIVILEVLLEKQRQVSKFIESLKGRLSQDQRELLINQAESRLDDEMNFFIRFDKDKILNENQLWITESGNCYHIRLTIAAYPAKKEIALANVKKIFS